MKGHTPLRNNQARVRDGLRVPGPLRFDFSGSYNYGKMRIVTAIIESHRRRDLDTFSKAKRAWLDNEREQLRIGHWCHLEQCEQLCPQPHSDFILDATVDLWLWSLGLMRWQQAEQPMSLELAAACEAEIGRSIAAWRPFVLGGVVCAPGMRAKDDGDMEQWRNRPADKLLALVDGDKSIKYESSAVAGVIKLMHFDPDLRRRLANAPFPKLRVPVWRLDLDGGGYAASLDDTPDGHKVAGRDGLTCVVHREAGKPNLYYDWNMVPEIGYEALKPWKVYGK